MNICAWFVIGTVVDESSDIAVGIDVRHVLEVLIIPISGPADRRHVIHET